MIESVDLDKFFAVVGFHFILLNPFLMSIYLLDLVQDLSLGLFSKVLTRAALISTIFFLIFAWAGDAIFITLLQSRFESFLIFGGIIFLIISIRFVFMGSKALKQMRGQADHLAGSIALPFMIGPGTVSSSILAGTKLPLPSAVASICVAMVLVVSSLIFLKLILDFIKKRNALLLERYIDIVGRISALVIGTIAMEMIIQGLELWVEKSFLN